MRKFGCAILILSGLSRAAAQNVHEKDLRSLFGIVTDARTGGAIAGVNVFLSKTTVGTVTDSLGRYSIGPAPRGVHDLVFQHVGYEFEIFAVSPAGAASMRVDARLRPKVLKGPVVTITGPYPREWRRRFEEFEKAFLGETFNAKKCDLRNPEAVHFRFDSTAEGWSAFSDEAVIVENRALGYTVRNHILAFNWTGDVTVVRQKVFSVFKPFSFQNKDDADKADRNRESAYRGSVRHFVSAFARAKVKEEGFRVFQSRVNFFEGRRHPVEEVSNRYPIPPDNLYRVLQCSAFDDTASTVPRDAGLKRLSFPEWLKVEYRGVKSYISLEDRFMLADTLGRIWTPVSYIAAGAWGRCGIADLLPADYVPYPSAQYSGGSTGRDTPNGNPIRSSNGILKK